MKPGVRKIPNRIVVYPKDVENITGRRPASARRIIQQIKIVFQKTKDQFVTVQEFCAYTGIDEEIVRDYLEL